MARDVMLLSVRPAHAQHIMTGRKTIELRRTRPAVAAGQIVAIYASAPRCAVIGTCRVSGIESGPPADIKATHLYATGIDDRAFDSYFQNTNKAVALHLELPHVLREPIPLARLKQSGRAAPVQTWRFLDWSLFSGLLTSTRDRHEIATVWLDGRLDIAPRTPLTSDALALADA